MGVEIVNLTKSKIDKKYFRKIGEIILRKSKQSKDAEISLVFVGDARMRALNKKYRKADKTTDVLSFLYSEESAKEISGEIIISVPQAERQAKGQSYPLKRELLALFVHGILHLAGYEDETKSGYKKMMDKQEEIVKSLIA